MNSIIIDLEMNEIDLTIHPMPKNSCHFEVMEIGAVKLDENLEQIDEFKKYVKPGMNPIGERYRQLTGITDDMVRDADDFATVFNDFAKWCGRDYKMISWGGTDKAQIRCEAAFKEVDSLELRYMLKNWVDFQLKFSMILGIHKSVALADAINYAGIDVQGTFHDAFWDAKNTASLYRLAQNTDKLREIMKPYVDSMKRAKTMTFSLGELMKDIVFESGNEVKDEK